MKIISISGAPGLGKHQLAQSVSEAIARLGSENIVYRPEAMTHYIAQLPADSPLPNFAEMNADERETVRRWVFDYYLEAIEDTPDNGVLVVDRFVHDAIAYAKVEGRSVPKYITDFVAKTEHVEAIIAKPSANSNSATVSLTEEICAAYEQCGVVVEELSMEDGVESLGAVMAKVRLALDS